MKTGPSLPYVMRPASLALRCDHAVGGEFAELPFQGVRTGTQLFRGLRQRPGFLRLKQGGLSEQAESAL